MTSSSRSENPAEPQLDDTVGITEDNVETPIGEIPVVDRHAVDTNTVDTSADDTNAVDTSADDTNTVDTSADDTDAVEADLIDTDQQVEADLDVPEESADLSGEPPAEEASDEEALNEESVGVPVDSVETDTNDPELLGDRGDSNKPGAWLWRIGALAVVVVLGAWLLIATPFAPAFGYSVDGQEVPVNDIQDTLKSWFADDGNLVAAVDAPEKADIQQRGRIASALSLLIFEDLIDAEATAREIILDEDKIDADRAEQAEQLGITSEQLQARGLSQAEFDQQLKIVASLKQIAERDALPVTDDEVRSLYDQAYFAPIISAILTEDEATAEKARERVLAGEDFVDVAIEISIDPTAQQTGAQIGPQSEDALAQRFSETTTTTLMALKTGDITEPIELDGRWFVAIVNPAPSFEDTKAEIRQGLEGEREKVARDAFLATLDEHTVEVNPDYGIWTGITNSGVIPHNAMSSELPTPSPSADSASPAASEDVTD